jgi:hypothetical protein
MDRNILTHIASRDQDACIKMIQAFGPDFYDDMIHRLCEINMTEKYGFYELCLNIKDIEEFSDIFGLYFEATRFYEPDAYEVEYRKLLNTWLEKASVPGTCITTVYAPTYASVVAGYKYDIRLVCTNKRRVTRFLRAFIRYDGGRFVPEYGFLIPVPRFVSDNARDKFVVVRFFKNKVIMIRDVIVSEECVYLHLPIDTLKKIIY